jgi:glycosyltransferase involved in cell wall biosynthesis
VVREGTLGLTYGFGREDEYVAAVRATPARGGRDAAAARAESRRLVEREYAWDRSARRTLELYRELRAGRAGAVPPPAAGMDVR